MDRKGAEDRVDGKRFLKAVIPSMLSQMLNAFFIIVDGFFIGGAMGDDGLAAINVAWPIVAVIMSTGMGIGTGGAVLMAISRGKGEIEKAGRVRGNVLISMAVASVLLTITFWVLHPILLPKMGAVGSLEILATQYLRVVITLATIQVFSTGLIPLLRGSGKPVAAMMVMIQGLILNIVLDWLFVWVWRWGMIGAALATATAQFSGIPLALIFLLRNKDMPLRAKDFSISLDLIKRILVLGASPFGLSVSVSAVILFNNLQALRYGGADAVAVYAILSYVFSSLHPLLSGIGEGSQPLISYCHGADDKKGLKFLRYAAFSMVIVTGVVLGLGAWIFRGYVGVLFGAGKAAQQGAAQGMIWYSLCLPFFGIYRICSSYFCAIAQAKLANILAYIEPLFAQPLCLLILPMLFGVQGIWAATFVAYVLLAIIGSGLLYRQLKSKI